MPKCKRPGCDRQGHEGLNYLGYCSGVCEDAAPLVREAFAECAEIARKARYVFPDDGERIAQLIEAAANSLIISVSPPPPGG